MYTERHLDSKVLNDDIFINGFNYIFRKDRNSHGGSVILSDSLRIKRLSDLEPTGTECIWLEISAHTYYILLWCAYRPLNADNFFLKNLEWSIEKTPEMPIKL